jgi:serine protease Do
MSGDKHDPGPGDLPAGVIGMGSGMIISADGLILTNRHVASAGDVLMVRLPDGTRKPAERVVIDDEQDLALIRIKPDKPLPFVTLANDAPGPGAECTALGFPMGDVFGITLQVSPGTVSSVIREKNADIVVNCKVNPGNSGGPLVDRFGNVAGVVTFKTKSDEMTDSYGLAIGAARVRTFVKKTFDKHNFTLAPAPADGTAMNTEGVYKKVSPAAVCIIMIRSGDTPKKAD